MKTCFYDSNLHIRVEQAETRKALFTVTYGLQVKQNLTYAEAARELGECIFHALACDGKLDNQGV